MSRLFRLGCRIGRPCVGLCLSIFVLGLGGCGDPPAFEPRASTLELIEPAQASVSSLMEATFGSVQSPVAWEALPIEFHGARGTVVPLTAGQLDRFQVELDYQTQVIEPGLAVAWVEGGNKGEIRTVTDWDAASGVLTIDAPLAQAAEDDLIAIAPGAQLKRGQDFHVQQCQQCHGPTGAGNGPTSYSMNPKPRDYRDGVFKYTSTAAGRKASRADLLRTLNHGIPGAYMPSYQMIPEGSKRAVIEYVRWLAIRGEIEKDLAFTLSLNFFSEGLEDPDEKAAVIADFEDYAVEDLRIDFDETTEFVIAKWIASESPNAIVTPEMSRPEPTAASLARGRELYLSSTAKCASCHGESGAGDGPATKEFHNNSNGEAFPVAGFHDSWGQLAQPRNLLQGYWGGGNRPIDMYRRLAVGVKGTSMPGYGTLLTEEQIWDLTNYVLSMPQQSSPGGTAAVAVGLPAFAK